MELLLYNYSTRAEATAGWYGRKSGRGFYDYSTLRSSGAGTLATDWRGSSRIEKRETGSMAAVVKGRRRFVVAQSVVGSLITLFLTYFSLAIADHVGTPDFVRYVLSPGYVLGMRFASGGGWLERLGSFGRIAVTTNLIYYGLLVFLVLRKIDWPKNAPKQKSSILDRALMRCQQFRENSSSRQ